MRAARHVDEDGKNGVDCGGEKDGRNDYEEVLDYEEGYAVGVKFGAQTPEDVSDNLLSYLLVLQHVLSTWLEDGALGRTKITPTIIVLKYHVLYFRSCQRCRRPAKKKSAAPSTPTTMEGV